VGRRLHRPDPLTGKKRQKTGAAKTRAEARQLEARLIREAGTGQHRAAGNKTVAELLDAWSEWRPRKGEIAERTMLGYASLIEHKILPALGGCGSAAWTPPPSIGSWPSSASAARVASTASTWCRVTKADQRLAGDLAAAGAERPPLPGPLPGRAAGRAGRGQWHGSFASRSVGAAGAEVSVTICVGT
jgi:hypothetical protein